MPAHSHPRCSSIAEPKWRSSSNGRPSKYYWRRRLLPMKTYYLEDTFSWSSPPPMEKLGRIRHRMSSSSAEKLYGILQTNPSATIYRLNIGPLRRFRILHLDKRRDESLSSAAIPLPRDHQLNATTPERELRTDQCMKLLNPLYGLYESGGLWYHTLARHHTNELHMKHPSTRTNHNTISWNMAQSVVFRVST